MKTCLHPRKLERAALRQRRGVRAGFTVLELVVVLALIIIIAGIGMMSFNGLEGESTVEQPGNELARMVKQASRAAVVQGRPIVIVFDKGGASFAQGSTEGGGHVSWPKGMKVSVQRWNGGSKWNTTEGLVWTFYPTGICDALRFKLDHPDGVMEMAFNPLTGSVSDERVYMR